MFCLHCGNEVEAHAKFCSKCGREIVSVLKPKTGHDMNMHINILAWLFIGSGILTGAVAFIVIFAGQVISRGPVPFPPDVPAEMPHFVGWITGVVGLGLTALAAGVTAAGVGLLQYSNWARGLATVMSVFMLFHFPIGTGIAIYAFWVLFSNEGQQYYKARAASTMA